MISKSSLMDKRSGKQRNPPSGEGEFDEVF
jgi:hypothetical protein